MICATLLLFWKPAISPSRFGFVRRTLNTGVGNKIVLRGYDYQPTIEESMDGTLQVSLGEPCDSSVQTPPEDGAGGVNPEPEGPNLGSGAAAKYLSWGLSAFVGQKSAVAGSALALGLTAGFLPSATAQDVVSECDLAPIEVEIFVDAMADELVQMQYKTGDFEVCPPESKFYTSNAFGLFTVTSLSDLFL